MNHVSTTASLGATAKIGDVTVTRIIEGGADALPDEFFTAGMRDAWNRQTSWVDPSWSSESGAPYIRISAFVLNVDGTNVLIDAGVGNWPSAGHPEGTPDTDFIAALQRAGFAPEDIDVVSATHLHFDHVGGNTRRDEHGQIVPMFPNARYVFGAVEWEEQTRPERVGRPNNSTVDVAVRPLVEAGVAELVAPGYELAPGISLRSAPGHTDGHLCVTIESQGESGAVTGDFAHHPFQLAEPSIGSAFDDDPELAARTRRELVDEWIERGTWVLGTHFPGTGIGRVVREGDAVRYEEAG